MKDPYPDPFKYGRIGCQCGDPMISVLVYLDATVSSEVRKIKCLACGRDWFTYEALPRVVFEPRWVESINRHGRRKDIKESDL